jgi:hypothetical protein
MFKYIKSNLILIIELNNLMNVIFKKKKIMFTQKLFVEL